MLRDIGRAAVACWLQQLMERLMSSCVC